MGTKPMQDPEQCPKCGRDLDQDPKPQHPPVAGFPFAVAYGVDPACGGRWHVWDKTSPLRRKAKTYVTGED